LHHRCTGVVVLDGHLRFCGETTADGHPCSKNDLQITSHPSASEPKREWQRTRASHERRKTSNNGIRVSLFEASR
jgi:hypothetical protein